MALVGKSSAASKLGMSLVWMFRRVTSTTRREARRVMGIGVGAVLTDDPCDSEVDVEQDFTSVYQPFLRVSPRPHRSLARSLVPIAVTGKRAQTHPGVRDPKLDHDDQNRREGHQRHADPWGFCLVVQ